MPMISKLHIGDHSFQNARITPHLTEISIGEGCFFRTVVLFIHSAFPAISSRVDIKCLQTIRIGKGSFHDLVTVNLSCGRQ